MSHKALHLTAERDAFLAHGAHRCAAEAELGHLALKLFSLEDFHAIDRIITGDSRAGLDE
jgi:hypothetical protein